MTFKHNIFYQLQSDVEKVLKMMKKNLYLASLNGLTERQKKEIEDCILILDVFFICRRGSNNKEVSNLSKYGLNFIDYIKEGLKEDTLNLPILNRNLKGLYIVYDNIKI
jgi:hypothetical protein